MLQTSRKICIVFLAVLCLGVTSIHAFGEEVVLINRPLSDQDRRSDYPRELLKMALEKTTNAYGACRIEYGSKMRWERAKLMLEKGERLHILQAATRPHWETDLIPIRIPLMKGLLGNRIFLIKKQTQAQFAKITSLDDLKSLRAGLGHDWSITSIFQHNGFKIVTGASYEGLFEMLDLGRFDYFPRGINEAPEEYQQRQHKFPDLHIEETLLLNLPLPVYFFVTPKKPKLAERVEHGLNVMIKDGSFDQIFLQFHQALLDQAGLQNRKVFYITNPNLTPETPLDRKELWLDLTTYIQGEEK